MKKVLFVLLLCACCSLSAQITPGTVYMENKSNHEKITATALDAINNCVRWQRFNESQDSVLVSGVAYCPSLFTELKNNAVEPSDVGKTGEMLMNNFALTLAIYKYDILNVNSLTDWELKIK